MRIGLRGREDSNGEPRAVTLFNDTFTNHYDPEIGIAAVEVLERGGCSVNVVRPGCCGRPLISQGLLGEARAHAGQLVEGLYPIASARRKDSVLRAELSFRCERRRAVAAARRAAGEGAHGRRGACMLFEEFAATLDLPLRKGPAKILLHGHCHQKSMGLLRRHEGAARAHSRRTVVDLDAGCCGMAGSFGYSKDHYDVSVAIANRKLLPAVKAMQPGDALVAAGTSCRHQVADLAGAAAVHPAVLIRSRFDRSGMITPLWPYLLPIR